MREEWQTGCRKEMKEGRKERRKEGRQEGSEGKKEMVLKTK